MTSPDYFDSYNVLNGMYYINELDEYGNREIGTTDLNMIEKLYTVMTGLRLFKKFIYLIVDGKLALV